MLRAVVAFAEAVFITIATYATAALVLFVSSANTRVPGLMTASTEQKGGRLETSLTFSWQLGAVLLVLLTPVLVQLHARAAKSRNRRMVEDREP